jgi:formylglycine-generating enzyme required for sulfatase activity
VKKRRLIKKMIIAGSALTAVLLILMTGLWIRSGIKERAYAEMAAKEMAQDHFAMGVSYAQKGEYDKAISCFTEAIRIMPNYVQAYFYRGYNHSLLGQYEMAIADYTEVIRINPSYAQAYGNRGKDVKAAADRESARLAAIKAEAERVAAAQLALGDPVVDSIGMLLVPIPAGEFQMGSSDADSYARNGQKPQHLVKISKPFYLAVHEVTQQQYEKVMGTRPWQGKNYVKKGPDYPAVYVSHDDAVEFCRRLSKQEGVEYRLPTEAEWEYACRAGTTTAYSFGDDASKLGQYAWYDENAWDIGEEYAHRVGQKQPNRWGLYDMHGNVWEWCQDWYGPYGSEKVVSDPLGPAQGYGRVLRGGSFNGLSSLIRSAFRLNGPQPDYRFIHLGFRAARTYHLSP